MTTIDLATKRCTKCDATKPLSDFHRDKYRPDGHVPRCKQCALEYVKAYGAKRRAEMGEDAWRAHKKEAVERHRERTGNERGKQRVAAYQAALQELKRLHASQFESLLNRELYERGLL